MCPPSAVLHNYKHFINVHLRPCLQRFREIVAQPSSLEKGHMRKQVIFPIYMVHSRMLSKCPLEGHLESPFYRCAIKAREVMWCLLYSCSEDPQIGVSSFYSLKWLKKKTSNNFCQIPVVHQDTWHLPWPPPSRKRERYFFLLSGRKMHLEMQLEI